MAGKSTEQAEIEELIHLSAQARSQLGAKIEKYGAALKVPTRMMGSMKHSPKAWLIGSMLAGIGASFLLNQIPRPKKKKRGSLAKKALSLTLTAARPVAKMWLTKKLKNVSAEWIAQRVRSKPTQASSKPSPFRVEPHPPASTKPNPQTANVRTPGP